MTNECNEIKGSPLPSRVDSGDAERAPATNPPRIEINALLGRWREAILVHNGEAYRLRVTANNKLILTK